MKLTENQLANMFQERKSTAVSEDDINDFYNAAETSHTRIEKAEKILNDSSTSNAYRATMAFKDWSDQVSTSVNKQSHSAFAWLKLGFKPALTTSAMALAIVFSWSSINHQSSVEGTPSILVNNSNDIINVSPFEGEQSDIINSGSFDSKSSDILFKTHFS